MAQALPEKSTPQRTGKSAAAFRTISEVATKLNLPQHVLRFWETKFPQVRPMKRGGGRRYYRPEDVDLLEQIRSLLYEDGYTIKGVQKLLRQNGARGAVVEPSGERNGKGEIADSVTGRATASAKGQCRAELETVLVELKELRNLLRGA